MTVYFIILALNESANINKVIEGISGLMAERQFLFKIIIVDDGSTDDTAFLAKNSLFKQNVEVLQNKRCLGVGMTLHKGLRYAAGLSSADGDVAIVMEGDATSDINLVPAMFAKLAQGWEIVIASRFLNGGYFLGFSYLRKVLSKTINMLCVFFFRIRNVNDYTIFYRGYSMGLIKKAFHELGEKLITRKGFEANTEILIKLACYYNARIIQIPFVYNYSLKNGKSKMRIIPTIFGYLHLLSCGAH